MQELIDMFIQNGLTPQQAQDAMQTISEWLTEEYPVAGVLVASWMNNPSASNS